MVSYCHCGREYYNSKNYTSCFQCYQERIEGYDKCIFCGNWHSPQFHTCYNCRRVSPGRDEAARVLKLEVIARDQGACQIPGCESLGQIEVDHIKPCFEGGTADVWNLQVLCREHNQMKGRTWWIGSQHHHRRISLMTRYLTFWWDLLDDEQRDNLVADAEREEHREWFEHRARFRERIGLRVSQYPDDVDPDELYQHLTAGWEEA